VSDNGLRKLCDVCGHLSPVTEVRCQCGASLRYAKETYAAETASSTAAGTERGTSCAHPNLTEAGGECFACGETIEPSRQNRGTAAGPAVVLYLGDLPVEIGAGIVLGRKSNDVGAALRQAIEGRRGVSRLHAWFGQVGEDLGSTNGTWARGERLTPHRMYRFRLSAMPVSITLGQNTELTATLARSNT
jgi:hypothetical protein